MQTRGVEKRTNAEELSDSGTICRHPHFSMNLLPLSQFASEITPGVPLPWGVRDSTGKLLLARGYVIADASRVEALLERGMFVDAEEVTQARRPQSAGSGKTSAQIFVGHWERLQAELCTLLPNPGAPEFVSRVQ